MSVAIPRLVLQVRYNYTGRLNEGLKFKERNGSVNLVCSRIITPEGKTCVKINKDVMNVDFMPIIGLVDRTYGPNQYSTTKCIDN